MENQRWADERIPVLLDTPAAVRFLSCEPLLGPLDLTRNGPEGARTWLEPSCDVFPHCSEHADRPAIDWVIVGGESGPGSAERKLVERCALGHGVRRGERWGRRCPNCHGTGWCPKPPALEWVRSLVVQCQQAEIPLLMKQWGGPKPNSGGRLVDGKLYHEFPKAQQDGA